MNQKSKTPVSATQAKYLNARYFLLLIIITSVLTVAMVIINNSYFVISSYITQIAMSVGMELTAETGDTMFLIITAIIAIIALIPYLLCYIFSKKHLGWMIAALALYGIDSLIFWGDFVAMLLYGDFSAIIDCVFRIFVIIYLILAVKYGFDMKKEAAAAANAPAPEEQPAEESEFPEIQRTLTITRKKALTGAALKTLCYVNGNEVCALKNGETQTITVSSQAFELAARTSNGLVQGSATVPAGEKALNYQIVLKLGMVANTYSIEPVEESAQG